jgi:predicted PurR-regulated permease PerM
MAAAYFLLGVPHPLLLGSLTAVAAMIPFGAPLIFVLAALLVVVAGSPGAAIAVLVIGTVVMFVADHFIRPALIGGATRLPFLWVLIGILGGVETLGLLGLFVGPATMAVLIMLWRDYVAGADFSDGSPPLALQADPPPPDCG